MEPLAALPASVDFEDLEGTLGLNEYTVEGTFKRLESVLGEGW